MQLKPLQPFIHIHRFILICFFANLFFFSSFSLLANNDYTFRTYSPEGGFFSGGVLSIQQDTDGFIWVLSQNALLRLDGYSHKNYYTNFKNIDPGKKWILRYVSMTQQGELLVAATGGLYQYQRLSDSFEQVMDGNFRYIKCDHRGLTWVIESNKVALLNKEEGTLTYPLYNSRPLSNIRSIHSDENGLLLSSYNNRIFYLDYETMQFEDFYSFPNTYSIVSIERVGQKLWVLVDYEGLFEIDLQTFRIEEFYDLYALQQKEKRPLNTLLVDKKGNVWVGSQGGLYVVDPYAKTSQIYLRSSKELFTLPNNSVWVLKEDDQKNIWLGTYSGGLSYVNLGEKKPFKSYNDKILPLSHRVVSSFAENDSYLWIGTEGGGLDRMNKRTKDVCHYNNDLTNNTLSYDHIKSLVLDNEDRLWIAMFRGGLNCLDTKTDQFTHYKRITNDHNSLISNNLRKIVWDQEQNGLWISYQLERLVVSFYSFEKHTFEHYDFKQEQTPIYNFIFDIYLEEDHLWIATHKDIYVLNTKERVIEPVNIHESFYLNAQTLSSDRDGNLWIGTLGNGLVKYTIRNGRTQVYDDILKYDISEIYSILFDEDGYMWTGTNNGLFRYDIYKNELSRFDERDGVQGKVFYYLSCLKGRDGNLFFGGTNGFTEVNPVYTISDIYHPKPFITDLLLDNVPVKLSDNISESNEANNYKIVLDHNKVNFGFRFSSDNYQRSGKKRFRYRLKGYDDRWIETDATERSAYFTKVPPGNYVFELLTNTTNGVWSEKKIMIPVKRLPAPWLTWWAYTIYLLLISGICGFIAFNYHRRKVLEIQLRMDKLDKIRKEEIHQAQLRFFTSISHDFRTPLSLIMAALDSLRQAGMKEYYYKILYGNARRLMTMINELMDFRTLENGKMSLKVEPVQINTFLHQTCADFYEYANQKNIAFSIQEDTDFYYPVYGDKNVLEKIILNLLNNAFRYTTSGGCITVETYETVRNFKPVYNNSYTISEGDPVSDYFCMAIRDTGIGISREHLEQVFDRYYTIHNSNTSFSSGIGLSVVKNLVLLHKGYITIFSEKEKGTDILVCFSKLPGVYKEEDFLKKENESVFRSLPLQESPEGKTPDIMDSFKKVSLNYKKKILLVEDNEDLRALIADYLSDKYQIISAGNGMEATKFLKKQEADLIISDIMMPVKDGITLCNEVKNDINTSHIPFILLTAKAGLESKMEGVNSGADMYIEKPVDLELLMQMIHNIFIQQNKLKEYYAKHCFVENVEMTTNEQDNKFFKKLVEILDENIHQPEMDVNSIAAQLSMSRSKLYSKVRAMTGKSIIEFINSYKIRQAARLILEQNLSMREIMDRVGIESQSYFSRLFKKEYGSTPTQFLASHKENN